MEKNNMKKVIICVIAVLAIIICIVAITINKNSKDGMDMNNNIQNVIDEPMPEENMDNMKEPSSSKQV